MISEVLHNFDKDNYIEGLSCTLFELVFNAVKANYAYMLILGVMKDIFPNKFDHFFKKGKIHEDRAMTEVFEELIQSEQVKDEVKEVIREEKKIFDIIAKTREEKRDLTKEEKTFIHGCHTSKLAFISERLKITLKIVKLGKRKIIFDIINDAPITQQGLSRISEKRSTFKKYFDENRVAAFYMENLDETESAGFGSAMVDSILLEWGLNPKESFTIANVNHKTCATIKLHFAN